METAISGPIQAALNRAVMGQPVPAPATDSVDWRDDWYVFMVADVSDETAAEITEAGAWPALAAFFRLLWKKTRDAEKAVRDAADADEKTQVAKANALAKLRAGILEGEGVKGLCRSISTDKFKACPKAMNRQLMELHRIGILSVEKPPASIHRDEKTGRIIRRPAHKGYVPASTIRFNAGEEHKRPKNRQGANRPLRVVGRDGRQGANHHLPPRRSKGRSATTPISPVPTSPTAGGQAVGNGRPAVSPGTRPAAGEHQAPLRVLVGDDAARMKATVARLEREKAAREAEDAAWREAREREASVTPAPSTPPRNATEAAENLTAAVAELPAPSRQKARRTGKAMSKAERQAERDAAELLKVIERKRRDEQDAKKATRNARQDDAKAAFKAARKARREPAASSA